MVRITSERLAGASNRPCSPTTRSSSSSHRRHHLTSSSTYTGLPSISTHTGLVIANGSGTSTSGCGFALDRCQQIGRLADLDLGRPSGASVEHDYRTMGSHEGGQSAPGPTARTTTGRRSPGRAEIVDPGLRPPASISLHGPFAAIVSHGRIAALTARSTYRPARRRDDPLVRSDPTCRLAGSLGKRSKPAISRR